ncbi:DUF2093 domain-containing protein [soil metagenome]
MNALDPRADGLAVLHYGTPDFAVLKPGRFVRCAVSGREIPLEALRYWSSSAQEAYAGGAECLAAVRERGGAL